MYSTAAETEQIEVNTRSSRLELMALTSESTNNGVIHLVLFKLLEFCSNTRSIHDKCCGSEFVHLVDCATLFIS